jgi:hypothetical protein
LIPTNAERTRARKFLQWKCRWLARAAHKRLRITRGTLKAEAARDSHLEMRGWSFRDS